MSTLLYGLKCHAFTRCGMKGLNWFCLRKIKSILGFDFDSKVSYQRIEAELSFLDIKWKWPQRRLQEQRLEFFLVSIKKKEFTDIVIPKDGLKRNRGRPRFRMIDAIKDDLKDTEGIDFKRIVKVSVSGCHTFITL